MLEGPEGPGFEITNSEMETTLETLYRIYYEKYANKESDTSTSSTSNTDTSLGKMPAKNYAIMFLSRKKQKGSTQSFVSNSNILGELNKYRETEWESRLTNEEMVNLNLLTWWKEHGLFLHIISTMSKNLNQIFPR